MTSKKFFLKCKRSSRLSYQIGDIETFRFRQTFKILFDHGERIRLSTSRALQPSSWGVWETIL